jgi:hypothetical protein
VPRLALTTTFEPSTRPSIPLKQDPPEKEQQTKAVFLKEDSVTYNLASDIELDGKFIAAQIKKARQYEAAAEEKAGTELRKAAENWTTVYQRLADVRKKCKQAGMKFDDFKAKYCPDLGRTKLYKALAIADGRTTIEQERERDAARQAAKRTKDEAASVTPTVTDSLHQADNSRCPCPMCNEQHDVASDAPTDDRTPEELSAELAEAQNAIVRQDEIIKGMRSDLEHITDPTDADDIAWHIEELRAEIERLKTAAVESKRPEQSNVVPIIPAVADRTLADWKADLSVQMTEACSELLEAQEKTELLEFLKATIEGLGLSGAGLTAPLKGFQNDCDKWLPLMTDDERRKARIHISEWKPKRSKVAA